MRVITVTHVPENALERVIDIMDEEYGMVDRTLSVRSVNNAHGSIIIIGYYPGYGEFRIRYNTCIFETEKTRKFRETRLRNSQARA